MERLELSRTFSQDPKSCVATNFTTFAMLHKNPHQKVYILKLNSKIFKLPLFEEFIRLRTSFFVSQNVSPDFFIVTYVFRQKSLKNIIDETTPAMDVFYFFITFNKLLKDIVNIKFN